ncbi:uncharacterized protein PV09_09627 [Verruconis gallopava]|uniref:Dolichyldiphosphatase n=1 Tax=Verruconis gallopava TaxID=253628 RepID=A0A0D1ZX28_9PEZI|nr:uncharacterized protein PV09_09627 [Verruconis gallopava]KIV98579.1 hypothetical protein PV09_09627 [Verruconis gallopava]
MVDVSKRNSQQRHKNSSASRVEATDAQTPSTLYTVTVPTDMTMDDGRPLTSFSLTHVYYDPADRISFLCAWLALVPQGLCIVYASLIWSSREAEIFLMFAGQIGCEALNWILKRIIKEERPKQIYGKGYGMPSSHAQFVAFFSIYFSLFLLIRHQPHPTHTHTPFPFTHRVLLSIASLLSAAAVSASRVYLNYHTPRQVIAGCTAGTLIAIGWFIATTVLRKTGWLEWLLETQLARSLRVRDLVVTEDLMDAGWARWEERRKRRRIASAKKRG